MKTQTLLRTLLLLGVALFIAACAGSPTTVVGDVTYSGYWRIKCNGNARSDGHVQFRILPKGGASIDVTVNVSKGTSENAVAKLVTKAMSSALDSKLYHVERDDWEDVCISARGKQAGFTVQLVESTLSGVSFKIVLD
jgi:hypothetical protein